MRAKTKKVYALTALTFSHRQTMESDGFARSSSRNARSSRRQSRVCLVLCVVSLLLAARSFAAPSLSITPQRGLIDEPLRIIVDGLDPGQEFTVRAVMRFDARTTLGSYGRFRADEKGQARVEEQAPTAGTYEQSGMGLLWSMTEDALPERFKNPDLPFPASLELGDPLTVLFELELDGRVAARSLVTRLFVRSDVKAIDVRQDGLVARLYLPAVKGKIPAVVCVGGSEGGLQTASLFGMSLASRGYVALAVAYFRARAGAGSNPSDIPTAKAEEGLPKQLLSVPLETIRRALNYLSRQPSVDARRIGMVGGSRGAELALLAASHFPQIKAVVGYSSTNTAWSALVSGPPQAAWTLNDQAVPTIPDPAPLIDGFKQMTGRRLSPQLQGLLLSFSHGVSLAEIPVERINGPILLISGLDDRLAPSSLMSDLVVARMKERGARYSAEHVSFPDAGHIINFPYLPTPPRIQLGGTVVGTAHADAESWKRVLSFLASTLGQPQSHR